MKENINSQNQSEINPEEKNIVDLSDKEQPADFGNKTVKMAGCLVFLGTVILIGALLTPRFDAPAPLFGWLDSLFTGRIFSREPKRDYSVHLHAPWDPYQNRIIKDFSLAFGREWRVGKTITVWVIIEKGDWTGAIFHPDDKVYVKFKEEAENIIHLTPAIRILSLEKKVIAIKHKMKVRKPGLYAIRILLGKSRSGDVMLSKSAGVNWWSTSKSGGFIPKDSYTPRIQELIDKELRNQ